jgi:hypothetical protein
MVHARHEGVVHRLLWLLVRMDRDLYGRRSEGRHRGHGLRRRGKESELGKRGKRIGQKYQKIIQSQIIPYGRWEVKNMENDEKKFSASDAFGISEKRADEIIKAFHHAKVDTNKWTDVLDAVKKTANLKTKEDYAYYGYIFGRMYDMENSSMSQILKGILG